MIQSKSDYLYYLEADRISRRIPKKRSLLDKIKGLYYPDYIWDFQKNLRKLEFYNNCKKGFISYVYYNYLNKKHIRLSLKLNFSIPINVFGPGLAIVHYGTIIVNSSAKIGSNCRLHACVNIGTEAGYADRAPIIGDNCYIGPGAKIYGKIYIQNGTAIGANAVVNKTFDEENIAIAGVPAKKIGFVDTRKLLVPATEIIKNNLL